MGGSAAPRGLAAGRCVRYSKKFLSILNPAELRFAGFLHF